jgi:hypothetical protein
MTFTVDVRSNCENLVITAAAAQSLTYRVYDAQVTVSSLSFISTIPACGAFVYSLSNNDNSAFDSTVFTFPSTSIPTINVQTNNLAKVAIYTLKVIGTIPGGWGSS